MNGDNFYGWFKMPAFYFDRASNDSSFCVGFHG